MNSYFSHDSNARNSEKMIKLRMKHKVAGYGVYFMLLERLRDEKNYMSIKDYNLLAFDLRVDASLIKSVVEEFGLFVFTDDGEYFYSEGFNKRMAIKDEKTKRRSIAGKQGAEKRWNNSEQEQTKTPNNDSAIAMPLKKDSNAIAMLQKNIASKVKESKVNKSKTNNSSTSVSTDNLNFKEKQRQTFTLDIWPLFDKKTKFDKAYEAYCEDILEGATNEQIVEALNNLAKYYKINGTQKRYMINPQTYFEERRYTDDIDLTPPAKMANGRQIVQKETLPDWAKDDHQAAATKVDLKAQEKLKKQLAEMRGE